MGRLGDLSSELLIQIFEAIPEPFLFTKDTLRKDDHLTYQANKRSLLDISLVCRDFSQIATPLLYENFLAVGACSSLLPFLRTISEQPEKARHVRTFMYQPVSSTELYSMFHWLVHVDRYRKATLLIKDIVQKHRLHCLNTYGRLDMNDWYDVCVALSVLLLPNLRVLRLDLFPGFLVNTVVWDKNLMVRKALVSSLQQLRELDIEIRGINASGWNHELPVSSRQSPRTNFCFLNLPQLRQITYRNMYIGGGEGGLALDSRNSKVTSIRFENTDMTLSESERILRHYSRLTSFSYTFWSGSVEALGARGEALSTKDVLTSLLTHHSQTLRHLSIVLDPRSQASEPEIRRSLDHCRSGLFVQFKKLESLTVDTALLMGEIMSDSETALGIANFLPSTLERLTLHYWDPSILQCLDPKELTAKVPHLSHISLSDIECTIDWPGGNPLAFRAKQAQAQRLVWANEIISSKFRTSSIRVSHIVRESLWQWHTRILRVFGDREGPEQRGITVLE